MYTQRISRIAALVLGAVLLLSVAVVSAAPSAAPAPGVMPADAPVLMAPAASAPTPGAPALITPELPRTANPQFFTGPVQDLPDILGEEELEQSQGEGCSIQCHPRCHRWHCSMNCTITCGSR